MVLSLVACGGGDSSSEDEQSNTTTLTAAPVFSTVTPDSSNPINLAPYIQGTGATLAEVHSVGDDNACLVGNITQFSFEAKVTGAALCQYEYQVSDTSGDSAEASVIVLATNATEPTLPPITQSMEVNSSLTIDVDLLLGGDFPTDYELTSDYILLGTGLVTPDIVNTDIQFSAEAEGLHRIIYTLEKPGTQHMVLGVIDISASSIINDELVAHDSARYFKPSQIKFPSNDRCGARDYFGSPNSTSVRVSQCDELDSEQFWQIAPLTSFSNSLYGLLHPETGKCLAQASGYGDLHLDMCDEYVSTLRWDLYTHGLNSFTLTHNYDKPDDFVMTTDGSSWNNQPKGINEQVFTLPQGGLIPGIESEIDITLTFRISLEMIFSYWKYYQWKEY